MKVKSYIADSVPEAMGQVKNELGRDAVILHTRRFRKGGFLGLFSHEQVEIVAAVDSAPKAVEKARSTLTMEQPVVANDLAMQLELAAMRKMMEQVLTKLPDHEPKSSPFLELLLKNDVALPIANNLLQGFTENQTYSAQGTVLTRHLLMERIMNYFRKVSGIQLDQSHCKTVALIGPTGVGKTTTVAKLAADFSLKQGYKVALITADTYRIAAVEQLKTYADIIGLPLDIVYSPDELKAAIYRNQDKNLILVDTAGRSPDNQVHLTELQALLAVDSAIETYLVLSTTTKYQDALEIVDKFSVCSSHKFLFTKADESTNVGTIFNLLYRFPTAISYITTGQNVPDDIELANPEKLANLLLKE
jgi:flagellar biosynthesis protein FlhF